MGVHDWGGRVSMLAACASGCLSVCVMACITPCHIKSHTVAWISHQTCTASAEPRHMTPSVTHRGTVYSLCSRSTIGCTPNSHVCASSATCGKKPSHKSHRYRIPHACAQTDIFLAAKQIQAHRHTLEDPQETLIIISLSPTYTHTHTHSLRLMHVLNTQSDNYLFTKQLPPHGPTYKYTHLTRAQMDNYLIVHNNTNTPRIV